MVSMYGILAHSQVQLQKKPDAGTEFQGAGARAHAARPHARNAYFKDVQREHPPLMEPVKTQRQCSPTEQFVHEPYANSCSIPTYPNFYAGHTHQPYFPVKPVPESIQPAESFLRRSSVDSRNSERSFETLKTVARSSELIAYSQSLGLAPAPIREFVVSPRGYSSDDDEADEDSSPAPSLEDGLGAESQASSKAPWKSHSVVKDGAVFVPRYNRNGLIEVHPPCSHTTVYRLRHKNKTAQYLCLTCSRKWKESGV